MHYPAVVKVKKLFPKLIYFLQVIKKGEERFPSAADLNIYFPIQYEYTYIVILFFFNFKNKCRTIFLLGSVVYTYKKLKFY